MVQPFRDDVVAAAVAVGESTVQLVDSMYLNRPLRFEVRSHIRAINGGSITMSVEVWDRESDERVNMIEVKV